MKTILNKSFWTILFLGIIISGTAYTKSNCCDSEKSQSYSAHSFFSKIETDISSCAYNSHCWGRLSTTSSKKDSCCKKKECSRDFEFFLNTQNPKIQTASIPFVITSQRQLDNKSLHPVFVQHKTRQSISIYTLIQSFLC
jgi:hypothetical protein